jgi:hypothetical protein
MAEKCPECGGRVVNARDGELCCSKCCVVLENADATFMAPPVGRPLYASEAENALMVDRNLGTVSAPSPRLQRVQAAVGDKDLEALLKLLAKKVHAPENADGRALTDAVGRIARSALSTYRSQHQTIPTAQLEVLAEKAVNRFLALYPQAKSVVHVRRGKPGRPKALTSDQVKTAKKLLAKGYSVRQAAAALGVKRSTLHSAVRKLSTLPAYPEPVSGQVAKACAAASKNS